MFAQCRGYSSLASSRSISFERRVMGGSRKKASISSGLAIRPMMSMEARRRNSWSSQRGDGVSLLAFQPASSFSLMSWTISAVGPPDAAGAAWAGFHEVTTTRPPTARRPAVRVRVRRRGQPYTGAWAIVCSPLGSGLPTGLEASIAEVTVLIKGLFRRVSNTIPRGRRPAGRAPGVLLPLDEAGAGLVPKAGPDGHNGGGGRPRDGRWVMLEFDRERVRANVQEATTEDLLDRATLYADGMESEALDLIEAELRRRGVTAEVQRAHAER